MRTIDDRFFAKVHMTSECWVWTAALNQFGYGSFGYVRLPSGNYRTALAHRVAYIEMVGPIPEGMELDHVCRNRACVRPDHLEPVTHGENVRRGDGWKVHGLKTHCPQGHLYGGPNLYVTKDGKRMCRSCLRSRDPVQNARRRRVNVEHLYGG